MEHQLEQKIDQPQASKQPVGARAKPGLPRVFRLSAEQFRLLGRSPSAMIGVVIVAFWLIMAIFGARLVPYDVNASDPGAVWKAPSAKHLMGTDALGRDIFSRLIVAAQPMMVLP